MTGCVTGRSVAGVDSHNPKMNDGEKEDYAALIYQESQRRKALAAAISKSKEKSSSSTSTSTGVTRSRKTSSQISAAAVNRL